jgi:glyoxylase I family protein
MAIKRREALQLLSFAGCSGLLGQTSATIRNAESAQPGDATAKEKVVGIGGFFFRSKDPKALGHWYAEHLGVTLTPTTLDAPVWHTEAGVTIFTPFPATTKYIDDPSHMWMVNFRVRDLGRMVTQLTAAGINVAVDPATYPNGRFARLHDPEGNAVELWQPAA